jgi:hypothetical protein
VLAACGVLPYGTQSPAPVASRSGAGDAAPRSRRVEALETNPKANDVVCSPWA